MDATLSMLLGVAVLLPLASFFIILCVGPQLGKYAPGVAIGAIGGAAVLSFLSLGLWIYGDEQERFPAGAHGHGDESHASPDEGETASPSDDQAALHSAGQRDVVRGQSPEHPKHEDEEHGKPEYAGNYYVLGQFGALQLAIGYYIDTLTICMFCMVTLIATLIHVYATGYMHEELHDVTDHEVTLADGSHLKRPGRYPRFFQYLSLFCFSMLGLVLAGNIAMVFVFWELVGICSYFLIGFYIERKSASTAANKAFIVNRVGDFGMIIGLMALWTGLGTFTFGDTTTTDADGHEHTQAGMFSIVRPAEHHHALIVPKGMLRWGGQQEIAKLVGEKAAAGASQEEVDAAVEEQLDHWYHLEVEKHELHSELLHLRKKIHGAEGDKQEIAAIAPQMTHIEEEIAHLQEENPTSSCGYWLMIIAGVGIFCGCVGKSAQFPLHTWLPDAMEGPTPVSALVHSATMVAAGVYLVGRFFPVFVPEVLLVIAVVGCITLFMAATIAITATDIKRVLAYSTISQLGYMMLALGVGGWAAGLMHLITHAFFKSLLFMCSGSVIHAVHTNEMPQMGGLLKKMPYTAITMLIGCLAIIGAGIPAVGIGLSGFYSKDAILEQAYWFMLTNGRWASILFAAAAGGAAITAFYMFRMWFLTFLGKPRDEHRYDHAHESPKAMYVPLVILSVFAVAVAWPIPAANGIVPSLVNLLEQARPLGTLAGSFHGEEISISGAFTAMLWPNEHGSHAYANLIGLLALGTAVAGVALAAAFYWKRYLDAADAQKFFAPVYRFLINKWWFDELYDWLFVRPAHVISKLISAVDRRWIDRFIDGLARCTTWLASIWTAISDGIIVDGTVNLLAAWTYAIGSALREVQTGKIRQYVMFIVIGAIAIFLLISFFLNPSLAG